jgi:crotonobetainyl-CoA:carnitine CoA-transferase CaiB-like acyl-CoA transferase
MEQALSGVTVADFSQMMQGPWATQKLAEMGADVIKIERIGGEWERTLAPGGELQEGVSPFFLAMNRNKRSITLDLKEPEGHSIALDIASEADILFENFRPGVMDRLDLGYDDVTEVNPDIVYVSGYGFGSDGPYVDRPGQDLLLQAMSGLTKTTGRKSGPPTPAGSPVVDEHSSMLLVFATMVALFHRERTGEGQHVEGDLFSAAIDFQCQEITAELSLEKEFERSDAGIASPYNEPPYGIYETADGHIAIAMAEILTLTDVLDIDPSTLPPFDAPEESFENRDEIKRIIEEHTRERPTAELLNDLLAEDVWTAEVNDFEDLVDDPQVEQNEMLVEMDHEEYGSFTTTGIPVSLSETPGEISSTPPVPGEHTHEILSDLGYDEEMIQSAIEGGITTSPRSDSSD